MMVENMKLILCTLFDSNYLDKGLVLIDSLKRVCKNFVLYVLPMDEKCSCVLKNLKISGVIVIEYSLFEDDDLKKVKTERSHAEYCWTCTAKLISFVLEYYNEEICTYIDSDLYFYSDPSELIQNMLEKNKSVQIIKHNFCKYERKYKEKKCGVYCVEFNTFLNEKNSKKVLESWIKDCLTDCSYEKNEEVLGDQKYLNNWPQRFGCIDISANLGAGVAPWNVNRLKILPGPSGAEIFDKETKATYKLIFFHFQNLRFIEKSAVYCCEVIPWNYMGLKKIYEDYLKEILKKKDFLKEQYGIDLMLKQHPVESGMMPIQHIPFGRRCARELKKGFRYFGRFIIEKIKMKINYYLYYKRMKKIIIKYGDDKNE